MSLALLRHPSKLDVKLALKEQLLKPHHADVSPSAVEAVLLDTGLAAHLASSAHVAYENSPSAYEKKQLGVVAEMRGAWGVRLHDTLVQHCHDTGQPLMGLARNADKARARRGCKWLYGVDDIVEALRSAAHPNHTSHLAQARKWRLAPLELATPTIEQLRSRLPELHPEQRHMGVDDQLRGWFVDERHAIGLRLLEAGHVPALRRFARCGVPPGLRARVWLGAMRLAALGERECNYYAALQRELGRVALATDEMVKRDAAGPDQGEDYFVFASQVEEVLLAFCRDPAVAQHSARPRPLAVTSLTRAGNAAPFPPSGVPPSRGMCNLVFPLCFVYAHPADLFFAFREMWSRFWCRLHAFSSAPGSLLPLTRLFEDLLHTHAPAVALHMIQLDTHPARIALGWITTGFAAYLPAEQTLQLWDRIVGFDSVELLPVLAAAIFVYRARWLLQATTTEQVRHVLADPSEIRVVPLLQLFLWDVPALADAAS